VTCRDSVRIQCFQGSCVQVLRRALSAAAAPLPVIPNNVPAAGHSEHPYLLLGPLTPPHLKAQRLFQLGVSQLQLANMLLEVCSDAFICCRCVLKQRCARLQVLQSVAKLVHVPLDFEDTLLVSEGFGLAAPTAASA
jgi:hypothetical protein